MLWSQYKLATIRHTEFLRKQNTGILNIANQNSNFRTLQTSKFQKQIPTGIFGIKHGIGITLPMGVAEIGTKNWNSQPSSLVPRVYPREGDWCAPVPYEIYIVAAVDVPNIPTGCHQAPSPEPPLGHLPQTLATCILVHVASLHAPLEALHQYLLFPVCQHHYREKVWLHLDHAPCRCPRQGD
jgi:hypothetical protein